MLKWTKNPKIAGGGGETPRRRNSEIDFMKLIASITIVFHHSVYATNTEISTIWGGGYMSVAFFFCVSGYLMAGSASRAGLCSQDKLGRETVKFMLRKIKNILPSYLFAWIVGYIVTVDMFYGRGLIAHGKALLETLFPSLLLHMTGLGGNEMVGAIWYLSAMYLCMPIIYVSMRTKKDIFMWVGAPLITLFLCGYMHKVYGGFGVVMNWTGFCYIGVLYAAAGLSCGCFCYGVSEWLREKPLTKFSRILVSFFDLGIFILCLILMQIRPELAMHATVMFLFAIVVIMSFSGQSYTTEFFNRFCGSPLIPEFSIAIYLCHGQVYHILQKYFPELQGYRLLFLLYLCFSLLLSVMCVIVVRGGRNWYQKYGRTVMRRLFLMEKS